ncbi:hypothetical protein [Paludibacter jiangxiensis]|uniref:Uncharacterized protein n=1 Tax=Paludibacter jiangxiensis TaxID=681398 RepID=A0A170YM91_9BACT|nr:hypothetical protein [Paludibacter jiangxiensis]GAT61909.1 hypothetical protein PJIAN_1496 [Paludibacter jiangxiensis]
MHFPFDVTINFAQSRIPNVQNRTIKVYNGITTFLGPNGSGKTQLLRGLKTSLNIHLNGKKIRYISAGRLGVMERYRSDFDGWRNQTIDFDSAEFGSKGAVARRHLLFQVCLMFSPCWRRFSDSVTCAHNQRGL